MDGKDAITARIDELIKEFISSEQKDDRKIMNNILYKRDESAVS
jgi:hypothetical protein